MTPDQEREAQAIRRRIAEKNKNPEWVRFIDSAPPPSEEQKRILRWAFGTDRPSATTSTGDAA